MVIAEKNVCTLQFVALWTRKTYIYISAHVQLFDVHLKHIIHVIQFVIFVLLLSHNNFVPLLPDRSVRS